MKRLATLLILLLPAPLLGQTVELYGDAAHPAGPSDTSVTLSASGYANGSGGTYAEALAAATSAHQAIVAIVLQRQRDSIESQGKMIQSVEQKSSTFAITSIPLATGGYDMRIDWSMEHVFYLSFGTGGL